MKGWDSSSFFPSFGLFLLLMLLLECYQKNALWETQIVQCRMQVRIGESWILSFKTGWQVCESLSCVSLSCMIQWSRLAGKNYRDDWEKIIHLEDWLWNPSTIPYPRQTSNCARHPYRWWHAGKWIAPKLVLILIITQCEQHLGVPTRCMDTQCTIIEKKFCKRLIKT